MQALSHYHQDNPATFPARQTATWGTGHEAHTHTRTHAHQHTPSISTHNCNGQSSTADTIKSSAACCAQRRHCRRRLRMSHQSSHTQRARLCVSRTGCLNTNCAIQRRCSLVPRQRHACNASGRTAHRVKVVIVHARVFLPPQKLMLPLCQQAVISPLHQARFQNMFPARHVFRKVLCLLLVVG